MAYIRITQVDAVLLLDENGDRIAVKYYPQHCSVPGSDDGSNSLWENSERQRALEQGLTKELNSDGVREGDSGCRIVEGCAINYYVATDFYIFVVGPGKENEMLLSDVCNTVRKCLMGITEDDMRKETIFSKLDSVFLILDDVIDGGVVMECDSDVILKRLKAKGGDGSEHVPLNQAIYNIRNNVIRSLLNS